jgi:homoserine kinase
MREELRGGRTATAFAPGSIGNVGPGFDVLGLAIDGIGDTVTVELATDGASRVGEVTGRDAGEIPREVANNCAAIAAREYLRRCAIEIAVVVHIDKGLPLSGGLGGSAASSVAGACAAHLLVDDLARDGRIAQPPEILGPATAADALTGDLLAAALAGETVVAGPHLDNIGPALFGGLVLSRSVDPIDVVPLRVGAAWWLALWTPHVRVETRAARAILPESSDRATWVRQMANTAALVHAFAGGDGELLGRALDDRYAEPRRAPLIPRFAAVKAAAQRAGAFGGSISGSGPTVFAIAADEDVARAAAAAMQRAGEIDSTTHVGAIERRGARRT